MAAVTIRNLSDDVVEALKKRAKSNGRSMEAEAREALTRLVAGDDQHSGLEEMLTRAGSAPPRSVPMSEVMARIAANPRTTEQQRVAREWAQEIDSDRLVSRDADDDLRDPWELAEEQLVRLRKEQGK